MFLQLTDFTLLTDSGFGRSSPGSRLAVKQHKLLADVAPPITVGGLFFFFFLHQTADA